jgi:translation initiation factor IF-2
VKTRVYDLAKTLGKTAKDMVAACQAAGLAVQNHAATLTDEQVAQVRRYLGAGTVARGEPMAGTPEAALAAMAAAAAAAAEARAKAEVEAAAVRAAAERLAQQTAAAQAAKAVKPAPSRPSKKGGKKSAVPPPPPAKPAKKPKRLPPRPAEPEPGTAAAAAEAVVPEAAGPVIRMDEETREEKQAKRVSLAPSVQELLRRYTPETERQRVIRRRRRRPKRGEHRLAVQVPLVIKRKRKIALDYPVTVKTLSAAIGVKAGAIIRELLENGVVATINHVLDPDVAKTIAFGHGSEIEVRTERDLEKEVAEAVPEDRPESLRPRAPVVTFLGHVDHGKTSLLDAIRQTHVAAGESGGITQHIGAYRVQRDAGAVVFLDTPGHEAFTAMRARGAHVTDVAVLVVAADDGVMPQTVEALNHARAAGVPIVVALNKMDKPEANPDRVKRDLANLGLLPEEWGGDTIFVETSAMTRQGLDRLVEMLSLQAEMQELKANPDAPATGVVLEAEITQGRGVVATLLVQNGTLRVGDILLCGPGFGRIRAVFDDQGRALTEAGPSMPVGVTGLSEVPEAGDTFHVVQDLSVAKEVALSRQRRSRQISLGERQHITLENLFSRISEGQTKELRLVLKADVKGSLEVLNQALLELSTPEVHVKIIHSGVGAISQSDVDLADASDAIVLGFHVAPEEEARLSAAKRGVDVRLYQVIYHATEEVRAALEGLLEPAEQEVIQGHAEVRQLFRISRLGTIAGCYVTDGAVARTSKVRLLRRGDLLFTGPIASLKRVKDDVREVREGLECGIRVEGFNDIQTGDVIEAFTVEKVARRLGKPV